MRPIFRGSLPAFFPPPPSRLVCNTAGPTDAEATRRRRQIRKVVRVYTRNDNRNTNKWPD